jgi:transposase InsO family protein
MLVGAGSIAGPVAVPCTRAAICGSERSVEDTLARASRRAAALGLSTAACSVATGRLDREQQAGLSDLRGRETDGAPTQAETRICAQARVLLAAPIEDAYTREMLAIEVDTSLPSVRVVRVLEKLRQHRGLPVRIVIDNGTEFTAKALDQWAYENKVTLHFITPGRPMENGYIESFHGKFREECLNEHWFLNLDDARETIGIPTG